MRIAMLPLVFLVAAVGLVVASADEHNRSPDVSRARFVPPDDEWSKWLVGEWRVVSGASDWLPDESGNAAKLDVEEWTDGFKVEFGLNGQFLIMRGDSETSELIDEQIEQLKKTMNASDEDMERLRSNPYKALTIRTIDPRTGEVVAYLFDSMRCIAEGRGTRQGNKETIEWKWSATAQGATSVSIIEKINDNRFTIDQQYTLPDGRKMEERVEMARKKEMSESATRTASSQSADQPEVNAEFLKTLEKWRTVGATSKGHELLRKLAGEWDVIVRFHAGKKSWQSKCTSRSRLLHGGRFLIEQITGEVYAPDEMGHMRLEPYSATRLLGYDNYKKAYVGAFVDNQNTYFLTFLGHRRPGGSTDHVPMFGPSDEPMLDLHDATMKYVLRVKEKGNYVWEVFALAVGDNAKVLDFDYTRQNTAQ